ncbi:hypothetical protein RDWZM_007469 [Blomia tropicalis]|uniref:Uncharacterized protein n=1 Tax=Blomia tropicalis TaxID=40697 RepID=A0A9Q0M1Q9_BLOTA|nr:hypothetical protein RDWZM_007469 [Blomia tropicalis]
MDFYINNLRYKNEVNSAVQTLLKYTLLIANVLIISDAIFLLINEKDSYQGEFIEGRHAVSKFLLIMLMVDIQSFIMILLGVFGIVGTKNKDYTLLSMYAVVMAIVGIASYRDLDASLTELAMSLMTIAYLLMIKRTHVRKYTELVTTIA